MESLSCSAIDDIIQPRRPCHEHADCTTKNRHLPRPPPSINNYDRRRMMMRQRGIIKRAALLVVMYILLCCHASSDQLRRLQGDKPWLPDQAGLRCTNDQKREPWMPISKTIKDCCSRHFNWDQSTCGQNSAEWLAESLNPFQSSASTQKYYLDSDGTCKLDSPEKPVWINNVILGFEKCCEEYSWDYEKCMKNRPVIESDIKITPIGPTTLRPTTSPTRNPYTGFYADTFSRKCLPNSAKKPDWNTDVASTHLECCKKYLDWAFKECVAGIPPTLRPTAIPTGPTTHGPTTSPTENPYTGFYADTVSRKCLPNSAKKPDWNTNVASTHLECCKKYLDWAFAECVAGIPPTLRPTAIPTSKPTAQPTIAPVTPQPTISSMPTPKPTASPTTLYRKPTSAPTNPPPTGKPTTAAPTNSPTTSEPTRSPLTILYYADTTLSHCLEDSPKRPQWNTDLTSDYTECCDKFLPWAYSACMEKKPMDATPTKSPRTSEPTRSPSTVLYYADTALSYCLKDSPKRPRWNTDLTSDYTECCDKFLPWAYSACMKKKPVVITTTTSSTTLTSSTAAAEVTRKPTSKPTSRPTATRYYADTTQSKCIEDSKSRPSWIEESALESDYTECCKIYLPWVFDACMKHAPKEPEQPNTEDEMVTMDATVPVIGNCPSLERLRCKLSDYCVWRRAPLRRCEDKASSTTTTTVATTTPSLYKYYVNTINGKCQIHTAGTPAWESIHKSFQECCDASWFDNCIEFPPMAPMSESGSSKDENTVIEVVARGSLNLYFLTSLPSPSTPQWTRLINALRDTLKEIFQRSKQFHPEMELRLSSLGYTSLLQRFLSSDQEIVEHGRQHRELQLQDLTQLEFELRLPILCDPSCQSNSWNLGMDTFEEMEKYFRQEINSGFFATVLFENGEKLGIFSAKTDTPVAGDAKLTYQYASPSKKTWKPSPGPTSLTLDETATTTTTTTTTEEELELDFYPDYVNNVCISDGKAPQYEDNFFKTLEDCCQFAWIDYDTCKNNSVTRSPTPNPTRNPTPNPTSHPSPQPTSNSQQQQNSEAACSLIKYSRRCIRSSLGCEWKMTASGSQCVSASGVNDAAIPPTKLPTPLPTPLPTTLPTPSPTPSPTQRPSSEPTSKPQSSKPTSTVYYPDLTAGVCKFDGNHATTPYQFATAQECCDNALFDYYFCMKRTNPYADLGTEAPTPKPTDKPRPSHAPTASPNSSGCVWHPNPRAFGTCRYSNDYPSSWESSSMKEHYLHDSHEACCDVVFHIKNSGCAKEEACDTEESDLNPTTEPSSKPSTSQPSTSKPTIKPTSAKPTPRPTVPYTIPPVVKTTIDTTTLTTEIYDGFEQGLTSWPWVTTPNLPWSTFSSDKYQGSFSARSHPVKQGEQSDLHIAIKSTDGGVVSFWIKVDVQMPFSGCYINVDGLSKKGYTNPSSVWREEALPIPAGQHVVMFRAWSPNFTLPPTGGDAVSHTILIDNVSFMPIISEGFEEGKLQWGAAMTFTGDSVWEMDSSYAHGGSISLRSPVLGAGQSSTLNLEVSVPSKGSILTFWHHTSVWLPVDLFSFKINGNIALRITQPLLGWQQFTVSLPPGKKVILEWSYERQSNDKFSDHPGKKQVWIDDIKIIPSY